MQPATRNLQLLHGFLILDKPVGITSAKAVAEVKKLLQCKKIGHGGTLDPLASGILPLAIGEATKAFDYVASSRKQYRFTITFGEERETDDAEGAVTATTQNLPTREAILAALPAFTGIIMQTPPVYSALKIDGKRAYQRARAGEEVEMVARPVEVYELALEGFKMQDSGFSESLTSLNPESRILNATLTVACGKGTYVRSLARDIARKCNSLGYISMLRRTAVGRFTETQAISLDKLPSLVHNAALSGSWVPLELALDDIPAIDLQPEQERALRHGQTFDLNRPDGNYMALFQGRIVALAECRAGRLKSQRVFNC